MRVWVRHLQRTVIILTTLTLLLATASYGKTCSPDLVQQSIAQLADNQKRPEAQKTLQLCRESAIQPLTRALNEPVATTRRYAAQTLGQIGWQAKGAVPILVSTVEGDANTQVRDSAVTALSQVVQDSQRASEHWQGWQVEKIQQFKDLKQQLDELRTALEKDKKEWQTKATDLDTLRRASQQLQTQIDPLTEQSTYQIVSWGQSHPWVVAMGVGAVVLVTAYGAIFWLRPLWLLKLGDEPIKAIANIPHVGTALSGVLKALLPLKYHPHVLDAWVEQHWKRAEQEFLDLPTVKDRQIHITLPVLLGQGFINELSDSHLATTFKKRPAVLLIAGEGGSGKTSLACQIAQWGLNRKLASHRLLPVLIESELDETKTLTEAIRGQLCALTNEPDDIPTDLLEKLLQRQRLLVIVDHLSEMGEGTRKCVMPELATFPAKALIITSRLEEPLGGVPKTILQPLRIEADRLLGFMQAYVRCYVRWKLPKQDDPFVDDEYAAACDRLRRMVGQRNITVLLARLYAEQMIEQQKGAGGMLPASVPELMLSYLNQLNRTIEPANQRDCLQVQRDAQAIAWECLKQTYRPTAAQREAVIQALRENQLPLLEDPKAQDNAISASLDYLEKRLRLVQILEPGYRIRIVLDPLAEYLAANYRVECGRKSEQPEQFWQEFLNSIDPILEQSDNPPVAIQGFLLAVRDCCLLHQTEGRIPVSVAEELARKAGLNPEVLRQEEERRRIRLLISELSAPELEYRIRAAEDLGQRGATARIAAPNLIGMLENRNQNPEARQAAAQTLGKLGIGAEKLLTLLNDRTDDIAVRRSAAEALGQLNTGEDQLREILRNEDQPLQLRQGAARALGLIGAPSGEEVPVLIVGLNTFNRKVITQVQSIRIWKEPLTDDLALNLVKIPGGKFRMGSPPEERERYGRKNTYLALEQVEEKPLHPVSVKSFFMSQFPITQEQWRVVAALEMVDRYLALDPAHFKGDNRPIETVSWNDAKEFCDRLSRFTGNKYRLPTETEWEYACRAGTKTPFQFGEILSTDYANYDGSDRFVDYGPGARGEFRQGTTPVDRFGVANPYGICDMHCNVWEWCLDHKHNSYEGAPADGSAWVTDGDDRYRMLRGGSWDGYQVDCRSASRFFSTTVFRFSCIGFRVVCDHYQDLSYKSRGKLR